MSLEERTLVVRHIVDDRVSKDLLHELFNQVVNVVLRADFAYIEFEHKVSVGYALALMSGVQLFGHELALEPRVRNDRNCFHFLDAINRFDHVMAQNPDFFRQYLPNDPVPPRTHRQHYHSDRERDNRRDRHSYGHEWRTRADDNYRRF